MRFAVVGNPIGHSLSPEIHLAFAATFHKRITYEKILVEIGQFPSDAKAFFADQGMGLNVTAPFKGDAYDFVDEHDRAAEAAGAVNTIHTYGDIYLGYNTDGLGLVNDLNRLEWSLRDAKVLILGAGGAVQGIVLPLLNADAKLTLANRTQSRAEVLRVQFPQLQVVNLSALQAGWDIVINATATGWQRLPVQDAVFKDARCYDLNYQQNGQTPFIQQVQPFACAVSDGLGMLVEQAAEAFRIWHGVRPQTMPVLKSLRKPKRQFIAGAVCPRCRRQDSIYVQRDLQGNAIVRACHVCTFREDINGNVAVNLL